MDLQSVLKVLINTREYTYKAIGQMIGGKTTQAVSDILNKQSSMSVKTLLRFLEVLDCDLVIRSRTDERDTWIITRPTTKCKGCE